MLRRFAQVLVCFALCASVFGASKPNIVLITLSSVRADRVGFLQPGGKLTPTLDAIARQSLVFERAYAQAPLTVVSTATILSGTYPQTHKATQFAAPLAPTVPFLPDILRTQGYRTAAFVGTLELDPKSGLVPGFDRGFAQYDAGFQQAKAGQTRFQTVQRRGTVVASRASAWIAANKGTSFFVWIEFDDADVPSVSLYNFGVTAADAGVAKIVAALRAQKLYDNTLVVIAADHGQALGNHGEQTHGIFLYDDTVHVPLLIKLPGAPSPAKRISTHVGLIDIAPTILEIAGMPVPAQMQGQSLMRAAKGGADQPVYSRTQFPTRAFGWSTLESWRAGKYLYIRAPKPELYDLSADPAAKRNLAATSKAILDTMASQLTAFDRRLSNTGSTAALTSSEVQKLASLGYVGLQKSSGATAATGIDPKDEIQTANKVLSALALLEDGKSEKAAAAVQALPPAGAKTYLAQFILGVALAGQQQCPKAVEHLHAAIQLQPDSAWAHYYMGSCLVHTGDYKTAAVHLEIATTRLPECAPAHALLAQAYEHLGRAEDAKRERAQAGGK